MESCDEGPMIQCAHCSAHRDLRYTRLHGHVLRVVAISGHSRWSLPKASNCFPPSFDLQEGVEHYWGVGEYY